LRYKRPPAARGSRRSHLSKTAKGLVIGLSSIDDTVKPARHLPSPLIRHSPLIDDNLALFRGSPL
jgi:hypothetical protein